MSSGDTCVAKLADFLGLSRRGLTRLFLEVCAPGNQVNVVAIYCVREVDGTISEELRRFVIKELPSISEPVIA